MGDLGIKVSQPGFDINAADYNMLFSSSWPLLKIASQGLVTIADSGVSQDIVTHGLGYRPMFLVFRVSSGVSEFNSYGIVFNASTAALAHIGVNSSVLRFTATGGGAVSFYYYIFRLPIDSNFSAPTIATGDTQDTIETDFGIKVTQEGKATSSTDLRDFVVHSGTRSPLIHQVVTGSISQASESPYAPGGSQLKATHSLGYTPLAYTYIKYPNGTIPFEDGFTYMLGGVGGVADFHQYVTSSVAIIDDVNAPPGSGGTGYIVVLKDPVAQNKPVTNITY